MTVFFNWLGLAWLIAGFGAAIGLQTLGLLVRPDGTNFGLVACATIAALDCIYRGIVVRAKAAQLQTTPVMRAEVKTHWLFGPGLGGSLMFIPAWATALVALVLGYVLSR